MSRRRKSGTKRKPGAARALRAKRRKSVVRQLRSPASPELVENLRQFEREARAYREGLSKVTAQDRAMLDHVLTIRDGLVPPPPSPSGSKPAALTDPKPGSAAAWINELCPHDEWRLMSAKDVHRRIAKEAQKRGLKWPSYSAVRDELRRRRG